MQRLIATLSLVALGAGSAAPTWALPSPFATPQESQAALRVDKTSISAGRGGIQQMHLDAGAANAGRAYFILGSFTGTSEGFSFGGVHVPLNFDVYTELTTSLEPLPHLPGRFGRLDRAGRAEAAVRVPMDPGLAGITLHHAYGVIDLDTLDVVAVSNPAPLELL